jgi:chemotaxis protein methyltransferase CheR
MTPDDFNFYKKFLYDKSGLALSEDKTYLLVSRLTPVSKKWNHPTLEAMTRVLKSPIADKNMINEVIDAMTTNETLFFRDDRPFKYFKTGLVPEITKLRDTKKSLRIWSAASSTGQEPYSIAMTLLETLPAIDNWRIEILATDISDSALAQARKGEYSQFEIQRGMPIQLLMKYFKQDGQTWKIADKLKSMVRFENFNLLEPMDRFSTFDIIFCRNVLIYFDEPLKKKILSNLARRMAPDGYFFMGGSETVIGLCPDLKINPACPGLYSLVQPQAAGAAKAIATTIAPKIATVT